MKHVIISLLLLLGVVTLSTTEASALGSELINFSAVTIRS